MGFDDEYSVEHEEEKREIKHNSKISILKD